MNNYVISNLTAHSNSGKSSSIDLKSGVNIICGPSNTGKSMIVACIDYLFGGSKEPFDPSVEGYNSVSILLVNENGEPVSVRRDILVVDGSAKPSTSVSITSEADAVPSGEYKIVPTKASKEKCYSDILLEMLGIQEPVKIISNQDGRPQRLTVRTFFHQFCIKEENIFSDRSIIDNPGRSLITPTINALAYLLYEGGTQDGDYEDPKIRKERKRAVTDYISEKLSSMTSKRKELQERLEGIDSTDIENRISDLMEEIAQVEDEIAKARSESQRLLSDIYETTDSLVKEQQLEERYRMLHTQYDSDINRLMFIIEGEENRLSGTSSHCPFCNSEISNSSDRNSYIPAAKAEMEKVQLQINDLEKLEFETNREIIELKKRLADLNERNVRVKQLISSKFIPIADELNETLDNYNRVEQLKNELEALDSLSDEFSADIFEKESTVDLYNKYDAKKMFNPAVLNELSATVGSAIKLCNYPGYQIGGISPKTFDVVVNNKEKKHEGKGYRAFLNSIFAFVLMKFIESEGMHAPKMLVLDSPILSLKEDVDIQASDSMKSSLFRYFLDSCGSCQVIIAENELPNDVDYDSANVITFGHESGSLRQGFLIRE